LIDEAPKRSVRRSGRIRAEHVAQRPRVHVSKDVVAFEDEQHEPSRRQRNSD